MSLIFPKPLPPLSKETEVDPIGFTMLEKVALKNTWRVIKRHQRKHARDIFLDLYTENEELLEFYRTRNGKINMHLLHYHPEAVLDVYDRLIEIGLDNEAMFHVILTEMRRHEKFLKTQAARESMKKQTVQCEIYFESIVRYKSSPTLRVALRKLSELINSYLVPESQEIDPYY